MSKFNIRESLLTLDKETDFQYSLSMMYESANLSNENKKAIAEMLFNKKDVETIHNFLNEAIGHMKDENTFAPLELASTLEAGMKVYKPNSDEIWTVKSLDPKRWYVDIIFEDEKGNEIFRSAGANSLWELVGENDTTFEVDDDWDIEWHPISDYFDRDLDEHYFDADDSFDTIVYESDEYLVTFNSAHSYNIFQREDYGYSSKWLQIKSFNFWNDENALQKTINFLKKVDDGFDSAKKNEFGKSSGELRHIKANNSESLDEDTIKTKSGKWVNKGKEGTHGEFKTKKAADAQRKAIFASGWEESLNEDTDGVTKEDKKKIAKLCKEHIGLLKRLENRDSINESVDAEKLPIAYDDIDITTYDFKHPSKETGDVPSHTFKTSYTYYADTDEVVDYIYENHFYDIFDEEEFKGDEEEAVSHIEKYIDVYTNWFKDEIKEYFRKKATEEANESEDWEEVERDRFTYDEAVSLNEEKPEYVDYNGEQRRLYKLSKTNKKTGEKSTRYFVKDKDYEPLTQDDTDINADVPNRVNFVGYKQFKTLYNPNDPSTEKYKGLLFPLFVGAKQKDGIEIGKWYRCGTGELRIEVDKNGKPIPGGAIQVDSKLGNLAYRPGWHLSSAPVTRHIGVGASRSNDNHNDYGAMYSENVWAKVEYSAHYDFTEKAKQMPGADKDPKKAMFTDKNEIKNGFYHYRTNSNADDTEDWLIADAIKVLSVLSDETVRKITNEHGLQAQDRWTADGTSGNAFVADFSQFSVVENMRR